MAAEKGDQQHMDQIIHDLRIMLHVFHESYGVFISRPRDRYPENLCVDGHILSQRIIDPLLLDISGYGRRPGPQPGKCVKMSIRIIQRYRHMGVPVPRRLLCQAAKTGREVEEQNI